MKEPTPCPKGKTTTTTPKKKPKDGGKKPPGPTLRKKSETSKISTTEPARTPNARKLANPGTPPNCHAFKTFQGTADDEKHMLWQSIKAIISQHTNSHKFGKKRMSSGLTNKIKLKLQNEDRTRQELREDLERIASEQHVSQSSTDNPSKLKLAPCSWRSRISLPLPRLVQPTPTQPRTVPTC
jgi:hypothetical protein